MALFCDSSGLIKRYVSEQGSTWVRGLVSPAARNVVSVAAITAVEVASALKRRQLAGSISVADLSLLLADFRQDYSNQYRIVDISPTLIDHAMQLAEKYALRGYDAVQLAAALKVQVDATAIGDSLTVISADVALNAAAIAEGLSVDDPNNHP